jgi:hypothetical protein
LTDPDRSNAREGDDQFWVHEGHLGLSHIQPTGDSMYDFACQIAAGEKFPSLAFGFEPLHSTVLVHHSLVPKGVKLAVV